MRLNRYGSIAMAVVAQVASLRISHAMLELPTDTEWMAPFAIRTVVVAGMAILAIVLNVGVIEGGAGPIGILVALFAGWHIALASVAALEFMLMACGAIGASVDSVMEAAMIRPCLPPEGTGVMAGVAVGTYVEFSVVEKVGPFILAGVAPVADLVRIYFLQS